jgi:hypothetical protein
MSHELDLPGGEVREEVNKTSAGAEKFASALTFGGITWPNRWRQGWDSGVKNPAVSIGDAGARLAEGNPALAPPLSSNGSSPWR